MPYGKFTTIGQVAKTFNITLKKDWFLQNIKKNSLEIPDYKQIEIKKRLSNTVPETYEIYLICLTGLSHWQKKKFDLYKYAPPPIELR